MSGGAITFTTLREEDLPLLASWRAAPHVARWFHGPLTAEQTAAKYLPRIRGEDPVRGYIVHEDGLPVGYVQSFRVRDHPDLAATMRLEGDPHAVDVLIGEPSALHRGLGSRIVRAFSDRLMANGVGHIVIAPDTANETAIRCHRRAGFVPVGTIPSSRDDRTNLLMERRRDSGVPMT